MARFSASKLKGKYGTKTKRGNLLIKFPTVPNKKNNLIVNIELTKIKVTVRIKSKLLKINYTCYLVGRHLMFTVTTKYHITWAEYVFRTLRFGRLYFERREKMIKKTEIIV